MTTQKEFIEAVSEKMSVKKSEAEKMVNVFLEVVEQAILEDGKIKVGSHFSLEVVNRAERKGRNPQTGEELVIPAKRDVKAKIYKSLKDLVK